jgi:hypothetical protein
MTANTVLNPGTGGDTIATEDQAGVKYQIVKLAQGTTGTQTLVSGSNPLPMVETPRAKVVTALLSAVTTNQTSGVAAFPASRKTIQASVTGTGTVSAVITWYGNNTNSTTNGVGIATTTLTGTTTDQSGADIPAEWPYLYCIVSLITGTAATVSASVAY